MATEEGMVRESNGEITLKIGTDLGISESLKASNDRK